MRARPCGEATLISPCDLRFSVILRGAAVSSRAPMGTPQERQQFHLRVVADRVIRAGHLNAGLIELRQQALDGYFQYLGKLANSHIRHERPPAPLIYDAAQACCLRGVEPVLTRRHDERTRALGIHAVDLSQVVDRLLGQIFTRHDAPAGQRLRQVFVHAVHLQQIIRRLGAVDLFLARDRLRQQHVAGAIAQFLDDVLVELFDAAQLRRRHIGDFLDGRETFLHQDLRHVLVHIQLLLEQVDQLLRLAFALGFGGLLRHHVQFPAGQLAGETDVLAAAADGLRQLFFRHRDVHGVRVLVDDDGHHFRRRHRVDHELRRDSRRKE